MTSSLNQPDAVREGIESPPAEEWRPIPVEEGVTVLKTPRPDSVLPPTAMYPMEWPSHWRRLFPITADHPSSSSGFDRVEGFSLGHFTIERRIGAGAMGAVFLAYDERLHRRVALKILSPQQAGDFNAVQRFQNEAQAAARLDHDHVARVFYYGEEQGLHFIAYEYVSGMNLRDLLRQKRHLSPAEVVNYGVQIASALRHTSRNGVVHRDIKPSNIIVTANGRAKLVDLGLAKRDQVEPGGELTVAGTTLGTFDYISPEQARDPRAVDVRSDIYSLGCTLYHLLTGEPPYPEGTALQKLLDHQAQNTPDVMAKNRRVSPALSAIIRKMMASDPARRYSTPEELLVDLSAIARTLGLRMISSDAAVLVPESRLRGSWWDQNIGWVITAGVLVLAAAGLQVLPGLMDRLAARAPMADNTVANTNPSVRPNEPTKQGDAANNDGAVAAERDGLNPPTDSTASTVETLPPPPGRSKPDNSPTVATNDSEKTGSTGSDGLKPADGDETDTVLGAPSGSAIPLADDIRIISSFGTSTSSSSLEKACGEAQDGDIIELRFNGKRNLPERSLYLGNKRLTIRNGKKDGKNYRPVLEFGDSNRPLDQSSSRLITVTGGSLTLINVDIVANVSPSLTGTGWALFSLERPDQVKLEGVTITVLNPTRRSASVIEYGAASLSGMPKQGMPSSPPVVRIANSLVRGGANLFTVREATAVEFYVVGSVVALDESLMRITARPSMQVPESSRIKLELDHLTAVLGTSLVVSQPEDSFGEEQVPLVVVARNNLLSVGRDQPLVDLSLGGDAMALKDAFKWSGERNSYDAINSFLVIRSRQAVGIPDRPLDYDAWKAQWGGESSRIANSPIRFHGDLRTLSLQNLTPADVALEAGDSINPAVESADDGTDRGAPLDKVPSPPKLESSR